MAQPIPTKFQWYRQLERRNGLSPGSFFGITVAGASRRHRLDQTGTGTSVRHSYAHCTTHCGDLLWPAPRQPSRLGFTPKSHWAIASRKGRVSTSSEEACQWKRRKRSVARTLVCIKIGDSRDSFLDSDLSTPLALVRPWLRACSNPHQCHSRSRTRGTSRNSAQQRLRGGVTVAHLVGSQSPRMLSDTGLSALC